MKEVTFVWHCNGASGKFDMTVSDIDVERMQKAKQSAFDYLNDCSDLEPIRKRALRRLPFYNPNSEQDIRIFLPEGIDNEL